MVALLQLTSSNRRQIVVVLVMCRIVEDTMPPIPEGCSELLLDFLVQSFHKDRKDRALTHCADTHG